MDGVQALDTLAGRFDAALEHARELLPAQGPIGNFVHHNTLHAYQHLPFHEALAAAASMHDAQTYLREEQYRAVVEAADLEHAAAARWRELPDDACSSVRRHALERLLLERELPVFDRDSASDADAALYAVALRLAPQDTPQGAELLARLGRDRTVRDVLLELGARDPSQLSNPVLIDFLGAYLDEGMARWHMPERERGLLQCFEAYLSVAPAALPEFLRNVLARLRAAALTHRPATTLCLSLLRELCANANALDQYISRSLLVLPGWSGMVSRLERTPADRAPGAPPVSLCELTALRLLLDIETFQACARELGYAGPLRDFRAWASAQLTQLPAAQQHAQGLFGAAKLCKLDAEALLELGSEQASTICHWLTDFGPNVRLPILHEAYERAHLRSILDPLARKQTMAAPAASSGAPRFQVMFCIDDREESIRRYFEELDPQHATYGVAGFFGVAMTFRGLDDSDPAALCPVVVTPGHRIVEAPLPEAEHAYARRSSRRNFAARVRFELADASRSLVRGAVFTPMLGVLATVPLTARVLFPHTSARFTRWLHARALPAPQTQLIVAQDSNAPPPTPEMPQGVTSREQAARVGAPFASPERQTQRVVAHDSEAPPPTAAASPQGVTSREQTERVGATLASPERQMQRVVAHDSEVPPPTAAAVPQGVTSREQTERVPATLASPERQMQRVVAHDSEAPSPTAAASPQGVTSREQAERVAATLENVGATRNFGRLVTLLGHGASSVNNPHHSAYDCGACGGRNGGPNARAFATMANSPRVRELLRERGIEIPTDTWFIGGVHDTTTDEIRLFDLERLPATHAQDLKQLRAAFDHARSMSAYERCRKFEHAPAHLTPASALRHVEERAVDLSQARPELGHATNAICVVGRRDLTRDLFLDRRAFLVSYDATLDLELNILQRILGAVVPVGAGINLEYYFSRVDNDVWGSGTKLPHNLAGLLGVMEGSCGDLRTGLPRQMIEVHDPVRLLSIIEAAPEAIVEIARRNSEVAELVLNGWVRVVSVHPQTGAIAVFERGAFHPYEPGQGELPIVSDAAEWYRGKLGFLSPVLISKGRVHAA